MKLKICLMGLLCLYISTNSHAQNITYPLKIGDSIPDITIHNILNYNSDHARLSEFNNKLIVLDFWATYCGSCIAEFPEEVTIQKNYKDRVQIILVDTRFGKDTKPKVELFFRSYHPSYRSLPCAVEDTILIKLFPHTNVGYYVWIKNNKVLAMTNDQKLISKNIAFFLQGRDLQASIFNDIPYDIGKPVFEHGNGGDAPGYLYRNFLIPYKPGLHTSSGFFHNKEGDVIGCQFVNCSIFNLLLAAHPELQTVAFNRIVFKLKHPEAFSRDSTSENWKEKNLITYQAYFPPSSSSRALRLMQDDLDKYYPLKFTIESRIGRCMVVKPGKNAVRLTKSLNNTLNDDGFFRTFPISDIVQDLNSHSSIPFIDETIPRFYLRLPIQHSDLTNEELITMLESQGFIVEAATRKLNYTVISDEIQLTHKKHIIPNL